MSKKANQALSPQSIATIEQAVFAVVENALTAPDLSGFFLVAVDFEKEFGQWYLRIYIDRAAHHEKMDLQQCETISRTIDPLIEALKELGDLKYCLEVSSPGLFRALKTPREIEFYQGEPVKVVAIETATEENPSEKSQKNKSSQSKSLKVGHNKKSNKQHCSYPNLERVGWLGPIQPPQEADNTSPLTRFLLKTQGAASEDNPTLITLDGSVAVYLNPSITVLDTETSLEEA